MTPEGLDGLRDIRLPQEPSLWPPAPGWWLAPVCLLLAIWLAPRLRSRAARMLARRRALARFAELEKRAETSDSSVAAEISSLMRAIAVRQHAEHSPAGLVGNEWLGFLDETAPPKSESFADGAGRRLLDAPYEAESLTGTRDLLAACSAWVRHNA